MTFSPIARLPETLPLDRWLGRGLTIAVSGGADSTALLRFLAVYAGEAGIPDPVVGHVNHRLRGSESDADADFVRGTAEELGLRYVEHVIEAGDWESDDSGSREAAARRIRYDFLRRETERLGLRYVATAHTRDDQIETVLHRILRGTGIAGLKGMPRFRGLSDAVTLVRPFLDIRRRDVLDYLDSLGKPYRNDSSNFKNDHTRNRIRNRLLPLLREEFNPRVDEAISRLAALAADAEEMLEDTIDDLAERSLVRRTEKEIVLDVLELRTVKPGLIREVLLRLWKNSGWPLRDMGLDSLARLADRLRTENGRQRSEFPGGIVAECGERFFTLRRDGEGSAG